MEEEPPMDSPFALLNVYVGGDAKHRSFVTACVLAATLISPAVAGDLPGVTPTEIKVGGIFPFSGPASSVGEVGRSLLSYVQSVNDRGGVHGRKINYVAFDDAYIPSRAVEHARELVERDEVAFIFSQLGTSGSSATAKYYGSKGIPSIGIVSGASKFTDVNSYPLSTTSLVSYETEGKIYAKYLAKTLPNAKYAILYQNDDLGKDYVNAFREFFKAEFVRKIVTASYEVTEPTIESQIVNLKNSGAEALLVAGTPKFAAQAIIKAHQLNWKALIVLNHPSAMVGATLTPAGLDVSIGVVAGSMMKDPTDTRWQQDDDVKRFLSFVEKYMPGINISDSSYALGYTQGVLLERLIEKCGDDLSRENITKQAKSLHEPQLPLVLPGIEVNTSDSVNTNFAQLRLQRWTGTRWNVISEALDASSEQ
jgi:ABC-type branched-subunit amino acid transport system substrate-binding protein